MSQDFWYGYDPNLNGNPFGVLQSTADGGPRPEALAWTTTYEWLLGAVPLQSSLCQSAGTVYTCDFLRGGQSPTRLVWDSSYGPQSNVVLDGGVCDQYAEPWVCGDGVYTAVTGFRSLSLLSGAAAAPIAGGAVTIGANPVLLQ